MDQNDPPEGNNMESLFSGIFSYFYNMVIIFMLILLMLFFGNYMFLKNMAQNIADEAEKVGYISSIYIKEQYERNPLSKIKGDFEVSESDPVIDKKVKGLGSPIHFTLKKTIEILGVPVEVKASEQCVNLGYYGNGYQRGGE